MPKFQYVVRDREGKKVKGTVEEKNEDVVLEKLTSKGYTVISIQKEEKESIFKNLFSKFKKVKVSERNTFTRQLVTLLRAGVPLVNSLEAVEKQIQNQLFKDSIREIIREIKEGNSFSKSLRNHPDCFNDLYIDMVKAGEEGGVLDETLERLAEIGEHDEKVRRDIKTATRYPILVIGALVIGFIVLITFVLPKYTQMFARFNTQLPLPTRILIQTNNIIMNYWYIIIAIVVGVIFGIKKFIDTEKGREIWDRFKINVPVLGELFLKLTMSRFTRTVSVLMKTGVPIIRLLELVIPSLGNKIVQKSVQDIKKQVTEGQNISEVVQKDSLFPPIVTQMITIGEETGKLDDLLYRVSEYYDSQTDYITENLTTLIEPFMILVLGMMILFIALGIFLPMVNLMTLFK